MDFSTNELLREVLRYPAIQNMKVTVNSSVKHAAIVGVSTFLGGIIAGPLGLALGIYLIIIYFLIIYCLGCI